MKTTIVTGASQNHFKSLCQFLDSVNKYCPECIVYVYDLGLNDNSSEYLINYYNDFIHKKFNYNNYPDYFNIELNTGEYAWKPACIWEVFNEVKDGLLIWCDAGNIFTDNIQPLRDIIIKQGIYSPESSETVKEWTHIKTLEYFSINHDNPVLDIVNRNGALISFDLNNISTHNFIERFINCALIKECIAPKGSNRCNHRQDQSIFTLLYYQYTLNKTLENEFICYDVHKDCDENNETEATKFLKNIYWDDWIYTIKPLEQLIVHSIDPDDTNLTTSTSIGTHYTYPSYIMDENDLIKYQIGNHDNTVLCCINDDIINDDINKYSNIISTLEKNGIYNKKLTREEYYKELPNYKYVICPSYNNDNHMYYESLIAGTIPIVLESKYCYLLKYKYYNVPFIITKDYSDINEHTLNIIYKFFKENPFNASKLLLYSLEYNDYNNCVKRTNKFISNLDINK